MAELSVRLKTIAQFVSKNSVICDVGTDHGYLPIYLLSHNMVKRAIAVDVNEKPLKNAMKNAETVGVDGIDFRLCDGLAGVRTGETDTVIIAGMGGEVISGIIDRGSHITEKEGVSLILQPTTSPEKLRMFLSSKGYITECENPVEENGKLYSVMLCRYTGEKTVHTPGYFFCGRLNVNNETAGRYVKKQMQRCEQCFTALKSIPEKKVEYQFYFDAYSELEKLFKDLKQE